jgi:putative alpha-1,2-mannosidase
VRPCIATNAGAIVIDLAKTLEGGTVDAATITVGASELSGELHHLGGMSDGFGGYTVYFVARAKTPWTSHFVWSAGNAPSSAASATGTEVGAALIGTDLELAVGLSLVSLDGARKNLDAEVAASDFDAIHERAKQAWAARLETVRLTGGTDAERRTFYTSLYHTFLMPSVIDDVDGTYQPRGARRRSRRLAPGLGSVAVDTYRTVHPFTRGSRPPARATALARSWPSVMGSAASQWPS